METLQLIALYYHKGRLVHVFGKIAATCFALTLDSRELFTSILACFTTFGAPYQNQEMAHQIGLINNENLCII